MALNRLTSESTSGTRIMPAVSRCQIIPLSRREVSFQIAGREVLRWNEGLDYPRPYFFPVVAPSGEFLTRMGHPGAPNHEHHQSIWFAHHKVLGIDFWGNSSGATIRQQQWLAYEDGDDACRMAVLLNWLDGHDPAPLIKQEMVCEVRPVGAAGEFTIELQSRFVPTAEMLELQQTNFGLLAVRVTKCLSEYFGDGILTNSEGAVHEKNIFGKAARWMDYSGITDITTHRIEGIAYLDHPSNPGQPMCWHVREDGWMCASPTMNSALTTTRSDPMMLRNVLYIHSGRADVARLNQLYDSFSEQQPWIVQKAPARHIEYQIQRSGSTVE